VRSGGKFRVRARPGHPVSAKARIATGGRTRKIGRINVYRYAEASWYGPGLYGNSMACGGTLTPGTQGVANKHLPCGTKVTLRHGKRVARVRVIDRGPYAGDREYDLTAATARKLRFSGTGAVLTTR
jgi:rare lipoprotein A (peptidoglycan hydrolase)